ncbi:hypothetical protein BC936DRAFT_138974 [Jimgerdemannia flammicorona]|uniref:Uncharacterized protein n=1 Tax=Jimgerdemannia flammicorona TaxID=994334 RepID=A0A433BBQ7_9FUNG|nr:hypothetical protein BC936DRAFT_138974 [Jimgerdemannia flammicorona]
MKVPDYVFWPVKFALLAVHLTAATGLVVISVPEAMIPARMGKSIEFYVPGLFIFRLVLVIFALTNAYLEFAKIKWLKFDKTEKKETMMGFIMLLAMTWNAAELLIEDVNTREFRAHVIFPYVPGWTYIVGSAVLCTRCWD